MLDDVLSMYYICSFSVAQHLSGAGRRIARSAVEGLARLPRVRTMATPNFTELYNSAPNPEPVIASGAKQSSRTGLPRRYAPRNDGAKRGNPRRMPTPNFTELYIPAPVRPPWGGRNFPRMAGANFEKVLTWNPALRGRAHPNPPRTCLGEGDRAQRVGGATQPNPRPGLYSAYLNPRRPSRRPPIGAR